MDYLKIKGYDGLIRDPETNSIINTKKSEYDEYIHRKKVKGDEQQKIQNLENEFATMKNDLDEIKDLLRSLINGS